MEQITEKLEELNQTVTQEGMTEDTCDMMSDMITALVGKVAPADDFEADEFKSSMMGILQGIMPAVNDMRNNRHPEAGSKLVEQWKNTAEMIRGAQTEGEEAVREEP